MVKEEFSKTFGFCTNWLRRHMMTHLPEPVSEQDIMEMFRFKEDFHIQRKILQSILQLRGQEQGRSNIIR